VKARTGRGGYADLLARRPDLAAIDAQARSEHKSEREAVYEVIQHIHARG
jgi:hypothetical protein